MSSGSAEERARLIEAGIHVSDGGFHRQDLVWARHSGDKPDIGTALFRTLRRLVRDGPDDRPLRALSIGSSSEPQLRVLHAACEGGVYLLDSDGPGLASVEERVSRQQLASVTTIRGDYLAAFADAAAAGAFVRDRLGGPVDLLAFHHSLYYAPAAAWPALFRVAFHHVLRAPGAIHAVLMAKSSDDPHTTTWLYDTFAARFAGHVNDQCLRELAAALRPDPQMRGAAISVNSTRVRFLAPDFESLMSVVWMILLYPHVHTYTVEQRREITEHVWREFFEPGRALVQEQDHLVVYRAG